MIEPDAALVRQATVTGHEPWVVLDPIFQLQDATPDPLAVVSPSPEAFDGPDLYSTTIEQLAPARVLIETVAVAPRLTGDVNCVKASDRAGGSVASCEGDGDGEGSVEAGVLAATVGAVVANALSTGRSVGGAEGGAVDVGASVTTCGELATSGSRVGPGSEAHAARVLIMLSTTTVRAAMAVA